MEGSPAEMSGSSAGAAGAGRQHGSDAARRGDAVGGTDESLCVGLLLYLSCCGAEMTNGRRFVAEAVAGGEREELKQSTVVEGERER